MQEMKNKFLNNTTLLEKICLLNKFKQISADELKKLNSNQGDIKLMPSSSNYDWHAIIDSVDKNLICKGNIITLGRARHPNIKFHQGKFISSNNVIIQSKNENTILFKYLYYFIDMKKFDFYVETSTYPKFDKNKFLKTKISIPSISIQNKIINVLDKFSNYQAELEAELVLRKKQYEYYRNKLLNFEGKDNVQYLTINQVSKFQNGFAFQSNKFKKSGKVIIRINNIQNGQINIKKNPIYFNENDYKENLNKYEIKNETILIAMSGATTGKVGWYDENKICYLNQRVGKLIPNTKLILKRYLYHILLINENNLYLLANQSGSQPNLSTKKIENFKIPVPPLPIQEQIVKILDKFSALINDINNGLPKEIELRKKQYEYYRNKLLIFE